MPANHVRPAWTEHEIHILYQGIEEGATDKEIAEEIGRSTGAVHLKRYYLGLKPLHQGAPIHVEKRARLASLLADGLNLHEAARVLGVLPQTAQQMAARMHRDGLLVRHGTTGRSVRYTLVTDNHDSRQAG